MTFYRTLWISLLMGIQSIAVAQLVSINQGGLNNLIYDRTKPFYVINSQSTNIYGTQPNRHRVSSNGRYIVGFDGSSNNYTGRYFDSETGANGIIRYTQNNISYSTKPLAVFNNGDILANVYLGNGHYHPVVLNMQIGTITFLPRVYTSSGVSATCDSNMNILASRKNHIIFTCGSSSQKLAISIKLENNFSPTVIPLPNNFSFLDERVAIDRDGRVFFLDINHSLSFWDGVSTQVNTIGNLSQYLSSNEMVWELLGVAGGKVSLKIFNTSGGNDYFYPAEFDYVNFQYESKEHLLTNLDLSMMLNNPGTARSLSSYVSSDQGLTYGRVEVDSPYKYVNYFRFKDQVYTFHNSNHHLFPGPITNPEIDLGLCNSVSAYKPKKRLFKVFCMTQNPNDPTNTGKLFTIMLPR